MKTEFKNVCVFFFPTSFCHLFLPPLLLKCSPQREDMSLEEAGLHEGRAIPSALPAWTKKKMPPLQHLYLFQYLCVNVGKHLKIL